MSNHESRLKYISEGVVPQVGTKEYFDLLSSFREDKLSEKTKDFRKKSWEKVNKSLYAQLMSTCNFITENTLRHFLAEFNQRAWRFGLRSMPLMFNIMESYFNYKKPEIYFELIEEENYLISFFDFIDFTTSKGFTPDKSLIVDHLTSNIIYNFNIGKDLEEIKFYSDSGDEFIIAGISIIRRGNEVTVLMIAGRKITEKIAIDKEMLNFSTSNPDKVGLLNEMKETFEKEEIEYEFLDNEKKYVKVLIASRIDLDTLTLDERYVAEEANLFFNVSTDSTEGFLDSSGDFVSESLRESYFIGKNRIDEFTAIFEAIKLSLYLPYFFNSNEESIVEETIETDFKRLFSSPITKRKYSDVIGNKSSYKPLYSLDTNGVFSPDVIKLRDDLFKIESNGYWKKLELDEIGTDKKGNPIHGRTWVNQSLSWFEAKEVELTVKKESALFEGKNAGYIYILRNPTMEKDIFKIGLTRNEVDNRVAQLSKTSVPDKFYKAQEWNVKDCVKAEKDIHLRLDKYRIDPRREFFKIDFNIAVKTIVEVVEEINTINNQ